MGATSVTGVGVGAADGNKGPGNGRSQFVPLLTPHIVVAGTITLAAATGAVAFPALPNAAANYAVIATGSTTTAPVFVTAKTDTDSQFTGFTMNGTNGDVIDYIVVSIGLA